jgi:nucleotide-binding universal stress UspA family protein
LVLATSADSQYFEELSAPARERFDQGIEGIVETEGGGLDITSKFIYDLLARVLAERGRKADLTVVGTRGHEPIRAAILGSVSTKVLHEATGPVVVVPNPQY